MSHLTPEGNVVLTGTNGRSIELQLVPRWWFWVYFAGLFIACRLTGRMPDQSKVLAWVTRSARWRVVRDNGQCEA